MIRWCKERCYTNSGSADKPVYQSRLNSDGTVSCKLIGYDDIQAKINSFCDSCSIELILKRCATGDFSGLEAKQGVYTDVTKMPKTHAELLQLVIDGRRYFDSLSKEVRDRFGNDFSRWFAEAGTDSWISAMDIVPAKATEVLKDEKGDVKDAGDASGDA